MYGKHVVLRTKASLAIRNAWPPSVFQRLLYLLGPSVYADMASTSEAELAAFINISLSGSQTRWESLSNEAKAGWRVPDAQEFLNGLSQAWQKTRAEFMGKPAKSWLVLAKATSEELQLMEIVTRVAPEVLGEAESEIRACVHACKKEARLKRQLGCGSEIGIGSASRFGPFGILPPLP